jgi:hypothetical protein
MLLKLSTQPDNMMVLQAGYDCAMTLGNYKSFIDQRTVSYSVYDNDVFRYIPSVMVKNIEYYEANSYEYSNGRDNPHTY